MTPEELNIITESRMSQISRFDKESTITINLFKLTTALEVMLENSASSNYEWWKEKGAMSIDGEWHMIDTGYMNDEKGECELDKIQEALNTLAEVGLLEIDKAFEISDINYQK